MTVEDFIISNLEDQIKTINELKKSKNIIEKIYLEIKNVQNNNNKIFIMGNGGSASTSSHFVSDFLEDSDDLVATEAARAIHDGRIQNAMHALSESLPFARTIPWQKRAISANKMKHLCDESIRVADFASDESKPAETRLLAMQSLMDWDASISRQVNRDIIEGRVIPKRHRDTVCIGDVQLQMDALLQHADGELLLETLRFANKHSMALPKGYAEKLVLDTTLPIEILALDILFFSSFIHTIAIARAKSPDRRLNSSNPTFHVSSSNGSSTFTSSSVGSKDVVNIVLKKSSELISLFPLLLLSA